MRNAVAVSAILQRPVRITKIRAGRKKPGLRYVWPRLLLVRHDASDRKLFSSVCSYQHTRGIELVQNISNGRLSGCQLESQEVSFSPGMLLGGDYVGDSTTAGLVRRGRATLLGFVLTQFFCRSVGLLFQIALPCALFANGPTILRLRGGTNADVGPLHGLRNALSSGDLSSKRSWSEIIGFSELVFSIDRAKLARCTRAARYPLILGSGR